MLTFLKLLRSLVKTLHSDGSPGQIATGIALGAALGLTPIANAHNLVVLLLLAVLNVSFAAGLLAWGVFVPIGFILDPLFDRIGRWLLVDAQGLRPLWTTMDNIPGLAPTTPRRTRIFRWQGIIPLALIFALLLGGWVLFGDRVVRNTMSEAGSKALGAELDIASVSIRSLATTVELRGIALADPFDRNRNLVEVSMVRLELEPKPLLEKKIVVKRLSVADVRTGTRRATPARPVTGGGF